MPVNFPENKRTVADSKVAKMPVLVDLAIHSFGYFCFVFETESHARLTWNSPRSQAGLKLDKSTFPQSPRFRIIDVSRPPRI